MTDGLDVMPIGVSNEGAVIVRVVVRPQTRGTVVCATRCKSLGIEFIYDSARRG